MQGNTQRTDGTVRSGPTGHGLGITAAIGFAFALTTLAESGKRPFPVILTPIAPPGWWLVGLGILEFVLYSLPASLLALRIGIGRAALVVLAMAALRLAFALLYVPLPSYSFVEGAWFVETSRSAWIAFSWGRYTLLPAVDIGAVSLALALYVDARVPKQGRPRASALRLWLGPALCCLCAVVLACGFRHEVASYRERDRREGVALLNLERTRGLVQGFFRQTGVYPPTLDEVMRPAGQESTMGLDATGRRLPARGKWHGPYSAIGSVAPAGSWASQRLAPYEEMLAKPLIDGFAADGGLWAYETKPPHVGQVHTRGRGYTLVWGIPYQDL